MFTIRKLAVLLCAVALCARPQGQQQLLIATAINTAPINVDVIIHANTGTVGDTLTTTNLGNSTDDKTVLAATPWAISGSPASGFTLGSSVSSLTSSFKVRNSGNTYTSASVGKTLALANANNFLTWGANIASGKTQITVAGYITFAPASTGASNTIYDYINVQTIDGHASILQLRTGGTQSSPACSSNAYVVEIETNPSFSTTHSTCITLTPGSTYWVSLKTDSVAGTSSLYVYSGTTLVGNVSSNFGATSSEVAIVSLGNGESGNEAVTSKFQWFVFDWTAALQPLGP